METTSRRHDLRDWSIISAIILLGFVCLLMAGMLALGFAPNWELNANMNSNIDPDSDYLTNRPAGFIEPVDPSILTPPGWLEIFQTPGATFVPRTPVPSPTRTNVPFSTPTSNSPATQPSTVTPVPTRTIVFFPPTATNTLQPPPNFTPTATLKPTNTMPANINLGITKDDGVAFYTAGGTLTYTVTITNSGPGPAVGAMINDLLPPQIATWTWNCKLQVGGANGCDPAVNSTADFSDTVNIPSGGSIQYNVIVSIAPSAGGDLVNTASVTAPAGITDSDPSNNLAIDTDQFLVSSPFPSGNIGNIRDTQADVLLPGNSITLTFASPLVVGGHAGWDLIYYERPEGSGIDMDRVIIEISDGTNWYPIFNWGNEIADTNSNFNVDLIGTGESDNRLFTTAPDSDVLLNSSGIGIELDGFIPNGRYYYIRLISPTDDDGDGCEIDAIVLLH